MILRVVGYIIYFAVCLMLIGLSDWIIGATERCDTPVVGILVDFSKYVPAMVGSVAAVFGPLFAQAAELRK